VNPTMSSRIAGLDRVARRHLVKSAAAGQLHFFVGAGISVEPPASIPLARSIIATILAEGARRTPTLADSWQRLADGLAQPTNFLTMEGLLQHMSEILEPHPLQTPVVFAVDRPQERMNLSHLFLAEWMLAQRGEVLTVNLDRLLESAAEVLNCAPPPSATAPTDFVGWETRLRTTTVWKLHGDADPRSAAVTLTLVATPLGDERAQLLRHCLRTGSVCFVGWRGADLDILPILAAELRSPSALNEHYWVLTPRAGASRLGDRLALEPTLLRLFESTPRLRAISDTSDSFFRWAFQNLLARPAPVTSALPSVTCMDGIGRDLDAAGTLGVTKLCGFLLRAQGDLTVSAELLESAGFGAAQGSGLLLREAALARYESDDTTTALTLNRAAQELHRHGHSDGEVLAWTEFGNLGLALSGKAPRWRRLVVVVQLVICRRRFDRSKWRSRELGIAYCTFYLTDQLEQLARRLGLSRRPVVRRRLSRSYRRCLPATVSAGSIEQRALVLRRLARVEARAHPDLALELMDEALALSRTLTRMRYIWCLGDAVAVATDAGDLVRAKAFSGELAGLKR